MDVSIKYFFRKELTMTILTINYQKIFSYTLYFYFCGPIHCMSSALQHHANLEEKIQEHCKKTSKFIQESTRAIFFTNKSNKTDTEKYNTIKNLENIRITSKKLQTNLRDLEIDIITYFYAIHEKCLETLPYLPEIDLKTLQESLKFIHIESSDRLYLLTAKPPYYGYKPLLKLKDPATMAGPDIE